MQSPFPQGFVLKGRYAIRSTIGQGGMGRTYLAQDLERFNETCVLKEFIPPQDSIEVSEKAKELFRREASVLYQIRHPQVPEFRATFESDGRLLLVQDYVEGKNYRNLLLDRLKSGQTFSENEIFVLMQQLLPVLSYLHSHNIIHRDISPENLMLRSQDNLPVLIDFGVVQETNAKLNSQMGIPASTVAGKAGYAPPEQLQSGNAYANSDLYALAVTSIVLMTGREPSELFDSINLAWNWQQFANVNPAFARVINQMLSYKPTNRYRSADEVMQALQVAQASFSGAKTYAVGRQVPSNIVASIPQRTVVAGADTRNPANYGNSNPNLANESNGGGINWFVGILIILVAGIGSWAVTSLLFSRNRIAINPTETAITSPTSVVNDPTVTNIKLDLGDNEGLNRKSINDKIVAGKIVNVRFTGERDDFLTISLTNGDNLQMTIESADQVSLDPAAKDNKSGYWEGRLLKSGTYYIKIKTTSSQETTYNLEVTRKVTPKPQPKPIKTTPTSTPTTKPSVTATPTESPTISPSPDPSITPKTTESPKPTSSPSPSTEPTRSPSPPIPIEPAPEPPTKQTPNPKNTTF